MRAMATADSAALSTTPVTMRRNRDRDRFELFTSDDEAFVGFLAYRVVDGAVGAQFLAAFKKLIEDPLSMLL